MLYNVGDLIKKSWSDYRDNLHTWGIFALLIFIPQFVLILSGAFGGFLDTYLPAAGGPTDLVIILIWIASIFFGFWSSLALTNASIKYLNVKKTDSWREHYGASLKVMWPAIYTSALVAIIVFFGTLLFIIPGMIFAGWYYFVIFNLFTNGESGFAALSSSKKLVRGRWWAVVWRISASSFVLGCGFLLILIGIQGILNFLPLSNVSSTVLSNIAQALVGAAATPLSTLLSAHLYFSLRDNPFRETPILLSHEPPEE